MVTRYAMHTSTVFSNIIKTWNFSKTWDIMVKWGQSKGIL